jgi:hypothetical protein
MPAQDELADLRQDVARLESELELAQTDLLETLPRPLQSRMYGYVSCTSREAAADWHTSLIEALIAEARKEQVGDPSGESSRAPCPLCHGGTRDLAGFAMPLGLQRHLLGEMGQALCPFMRATRWLARRHLTRLEERAARP